MGLADGTVLLLRNLDETLGGAQKSATSTDSGSPAVTLPKFKVAHQPSSHSDDATPVTALGFSTHLPKSTQTGTQSNVGKAFRSKQRKALAVFDENRALTTTEKSPTVHLFFATLNKIMKYTVLGKGAGSPPSVVDDVGCALGCGMMIPPLSSSSGTEVNRLAEKLVVAREEAIYVVGVDGREMSLAFEGMSSHLAEVV